MDNNLSIYNQVRQVPKEAQKPFNNGRFNGTDINPMWRIKKMTEVFGPCGIGWYYQPVNREIITASDGTKCALVSVNLFIKTEDGKWSSPIYGEGGNTFESKTKTGYINVSDEAYKMALTDAISNATKQLGVGADIWFGNDKEHGTKYDTKTVQAAPQKTMVQPLKDAVAGVTLEEVCKSVESATTTAEVTQLWNKYKSVFSGEDADKFKTLVGARGKALKQVEQAS